MQKPRVLVFPANIQDSNTFSLHAEMLGMQVIRASSVSEGATSWLPYITEESFPEQFFLFLSKNKIDYIFTTHMGVYVFLKKLLHTPRKYGIHYEGIIPKLCDPSPFQLVKNDFGECQQWASIIFEDKLAEKITNDTPIAPELSLHTYAGLYRQFIQTPGQCDVDKLRTLCTIARLAPKGDVVEIGSLYGRSAQALANLTYLYHINTMISVDPWDFEEACDQGPQAKILETDAESISLETIFNYFVSLASLQPAMSYIKEPSIKAIETYKRAVQLGVLYAKYLNPVPIAGTISILHIDGNHAYESVVQDVETWSPYIRPSGWLLLDDYTWPFGDGPKRCGDMLCRSSQFDCSFVVGDTIYLRKCP